MGNSRHRHPRITLYQGSICRGWPRVWSLFDFVKFGRFWSLFAKIDQNYEKSTFFAEMRQFYKIFGTFGAENWSLFDFGHPLLRGSPHIRSLPNTYWPSNRIECMRWIESIFWRLISHVLLDPEKHLKTWNRLRIIILRAPRETQEKSNINVTFFVPKKFDPLRCNMSQNQPVKLQE